MSSTTHTLCSGSYGLIRTECGPRPSSNRWSHCVHDSTDFPLPSTTTMQLRNSGVGVVACSLNDPQKPVNPGGSVGGSFSSAPLYTGPFIHRIPLSSEVTRKHARF